MSQKLLDAAVYILQQQPNGRMKRLRHAKMLYFADYEYARSFGKGRSFTGRYTRMQFGPVPVGYFDWLKMAVPPNALMFEAGQYAALTAVGRAYVPALTSEERACIDITLEEFPLSRMDYARLSYKTGPMLDLQRRYPNKEDQMNRDLNFAHAEQYEIFKTEGIDTSFLQSDEYKAYIASEK